VPTVDLTHVDLDAYLAVMQPTWPGLELEDLQRLVTVGHVFGHLAALRAVSPRLGAQTTHELRPTLDTLESLHAQLTQASQTTPCSTQVSVPCDAARLGKTKKSVRGRSR